MTRSDQERAREKNFGQMDQLEQSMKCCKNLFLKQSSPDEKKGEYSKLDLNSLCDLWDQN